MSNTLKNTTLAIYTAISLVIVTLSTIKPILSVSLILSLLFLGLLVGFLSGKLTSRHYVIMLIPSVIISPMVKIPGMFASLRIDDLWLAFGGVLLLIKLAINSRNLKFEFPRFSKLLLAFIVWIAITIFISSFREPGLYSTRDWTEVYKSLKILVYLLIAINIKLDTVKLKKMINVFLIFLSASAIFGILQYFNLFDINSWLTPYYIFETKVYGLETQGRVVGTFGNPNIFGGAMLIGIALSFSNLLNKFKMRYLLLLGLFFTAITMSLSRTALVAAVLLILIMSISVLWRSKKKGLVLFIFSLIPVVGAIGLWFAPERFFRRISRMGDLATDTSFQARLGMWKDIWVSRSKINMLTGTGPTSNLRITFDNEWLEMFTYYGFVGLLLFLIAFVLMYYRLGKLDSNAISFYNIAVRSLLIVFGASMIMLSIYNQLQLMPVIILLTGAVLGVNTDKRGVANKKDSSFVA